MRRILIGGSLFTLLQACILISPLDEATPDGVPSGGSSGSGGAGQSGSAGTGGAPSTGGSSSGGTGGAGPSTGGSSGSGGSGGQPPVEYKCADPLMIDDMEHPSRRSAICTTDGRSGGWFVYTDGTGTSDPPPSDASTPPVPYTALETPRGSSTHAIHLTASGQTEFGGGIGVSVANGGAFDASAYAGIQFWARGQGSLRAEVATIDTQENTFGGACDPANGTCGDHYQVPFTLTSSWQQYTVLFAELRQRGFGVPALSFFSNEVMGVTFGWDAGTTLDLWIDDLRFLEPACSNDTYTSTCTGGTFTACEWNAAYSYDCADFCPFVGFAEPTGQSCTQDGYCNCGDPLSATCETGAFFVCDCFELLGSPCPDGQLITEYRGCFRSVPDFDYVGCFAGYATYVEGTADLTACADAYYSCLDIDAN